MWTFLRLGKNWQNPEHFGRKKSLTERGAGSVLLVILSRFREFRCRGFFRTQHFVAVGGGLTYECWRSGDVMVRRVMGRGGDLVTS